jgi:hypothetical protein
MLEKTTCENFCQKGPPAAVRITGMWAGLEAAAMRQHAATPIGGTQHAATPIGGTQHAATPIGGRAHPAGRLRTETDVPATATAAGA